MAKGGLEARPRGDGLLVAWWAVAKGGLEARPRGDGRPGGGAWGEQGIRSQGN
jgi:hypothetical protein